MWKKKKKRDQLRRSRNKKSRMCNRSYRYGGPVNVPFYVTSKLRHIVGKYCFAVIPTIPRIYPLVSARVSLGVAMREQRNDDRLVVSRCRLLLRVVKPVARAWRERNENHDCVKRFARTDGIFRRRTIPVRVRVISSRVC